MADMAPEDHQGRAFLDGHGLAQGVLDGVKILSRLTEVQHVPAIGAKSVRRVVR